MSKPSTQNAVVSPNDRVTLDGRHSRYLDKFKDGIMLESECDGPRTVFALTWADIEQSLHSRRLVIQKGYYDMNKPASLGKLISAEQVADFEKFNARPLGHPLSQQSPSQARDLRPMDILEMDDHKMDIARVGLNLGIWSRLHPEVQARLEQARFVWATAAMDVCTRSLCALRLNLKTPDVGSVIATLAMAVRDKGAENLPNLPQCGRPSGVHVDGMLPYHSAAFIDAVLGLTGKHPIPAVKHPHLRGRVERMFRTLTSGRLGLLPDVVGDSILLVENYDAAKHSHLTDTELLDLFALLIVERYHAIPQRALDGPTPLECWVRLSQEGLVPPPVSKGEYRELFGGELTRKAGANGITILGINYHSSHLAKVAGTGSELELKVRLNEQDISVVSYRDPRDGSYHEAAATIEGLDNVSLSEWMDILQTITWDEDRAIASRLSVAASLNDLWGRNGTTP